MPTLNKAQRELLAFIFDSQPHALTSSLSEWVAGSTRYAAFLDRYKDKIRKKLRVTRDKEALADLLFELQIPHWLLQNKRFELEYEPYASAKTRGPDYAFTFRANFVFNIEATHVRGLQDPVAGEAAIDQRLIDVLCGKLGQMLPNMANLLFLAIPKPVSMDYLADHLAWMRSKAESKDAKFFARYNFSSPGGFLTVFKRLSGVYAFGGAGETAAWLNSQSSLKLPGDLKNILARGFTKDPTA